MANIKPYTDQIKNAVYGEEVRDSIVNAIEKVNDDNESYQNIKDQITSDKEAIDRQVEEFADMVEGATDIKTALETAIQNANTAKTNLTNATTAADTAKSNLQSVTTTANTAKSNLEKATTDANTAKSNADTAKSQLVTATNNANTAKSNDVVSISDDATYYDGKKKVPAWVRKKKWIVRQVSGDRAVIDKSQDGKNAICSPINVKYLTVDGASTSTSTATTFKSYLVKVTTDALNIRKGAGTNYAVTGCIRDRGTYTIVAESTGQGSTKWGKLKSGAGWISLDYVKKV